MLLKITRELTPEEVKERISCFERKFGSFETFEEKFLKKRLDAKQMRTYFEWAELINSYKGYVEEGTLDYIAEEVKDFTPDQLASLTPKRIELLYQIAALRVESINDLAQKIRRNVKNVYQDLKVLSSFGFVRLNKRKRKNIVPETLVKEITFLIR